MLHRFVWKIAAPMFGLGGVLLAVGTFAAWNVNSQQQASSKLISHELHVMVVFPGLQFEMREIRYRLSQFLRTNDRLLLDSIQTLHQNADRLLTEAKDLARTPEEQVLIRIIETGYEKFFAKFKRLTDTLPAELTRNSSIYTELTVELTSLADDVLTNEVLQPLRECIALNQEVVERTNAANQLTAQHLRIGFLMLGLCGGAAGLLMGLGIARLVVRSIVQLNVSIRSVAGKLHDVKVPISFTHTVDLQGLESSLRMLEADIAEVVSRLQQRETELLRSEHLSQVGQLAAGLAHELRNPLMPMKMLVQAALERDDGIGLKGRSLSIINDEIGRLELSIQAFLDFARPPSPEKTSVDLNEVLQQVLDLVSGKAQQQHVTILAHLPSSQFMVTVDRTQIRQLILNLLLNALDALASGGIVELHVETNTPPPSSVPNLSLSERDAPENLNPLSHLQRELSQHPCVQSWFSIRISDNGPGIDPQFLDTLFDPFVTTKETGTGLGLSICRRIALSHQGSLIVHNRETGGAEFVLSLPRFV